jgi:hypothetical protein
MLSLIVNNRVSTVVKMLGHEKNITLDQFFVLGNQYRMGKF